MATQLNEKSLICAEISVLLKSLKMKIFIDPTRPDTGVYSDSQIAEFPVEELRTILSTLRDLSRSLGGSRD